MSRRWVWVVLCVLDPFLLRAQATASVAGRVVDTKTGAPLSSAVVSIPASRVGSLTDSLGRFRIENVSPGSLIIAARFPGYIERIDTVDAQSGRETTVDFALVVSPVVLGEVRSTTLPAERDAFNGQAASGALTLSQQSLENLPRLSEADVMREAQLLPGVQSRNDYSAGLNVRGGEVDQNLVLMDGYPIFNPFHLGGLFGTFIDGAVGDVDLLTGVLPAQYGGRLSSVMNVQSAEEYRPGVHGTSTLTPLALNATIGGTSDQARGSWQISGRRTYADALLGLLGKSTVPYHFEDVQAHGTYRWGDATTLSTTLYNGGDVVDVSASADDQPFHFSWGNTVGGVTLTSVRPSGLELTQRASLSTFSTALDLDQGALKLSNHIQELRVGGDVLWSAATQHQAVGYEITNDNIQYGATSTSASVPFFQRRQSVAALAVYYDDAWRPGRWLVDVGARLEDIPANHWAVVSPRVSTKYFITSNFALTAAVGQNSQWLHSLAREDLPVQLFNFWVASDRNAPVSRSTDYTLGTEAWGSRTQFVRVEGYVKRYGSLLEPNPADADGSAGDAFVATTGTSSGVDILLRQLSGKRAAGWVTYDYGYNRRTQNGVSYAPSQDRQQSLNLVLTYRSAPRCVLAARFGYESGTPYTDVVGEVERRGYSIGTGSWAASDTTQLEALGGVRNAKRLPATQRLDLSVTYDSPGRVALVPFFSLINAYNASNVLMYEFNYADRPATRTALSQLPFLPTLGVTVKF